MAEYFVTYFDWVGVGMSLCSYRWVERCSACHKNNIGW